MAGTLTVDTLKSGLSTPTVFQNTSGTEIGQLARCWVNCNQSPVAIRASFNVSSLTDQGSNVMQVNFSTTLADANFATTSYCRDPNDDAIGCWAGGIGSESLSASYKRLRTTFTSGEISAMMGR